MVNADLFYEGVWYLIALLKLTDGLQNHGVFYLYKYVYWKLC